jgi:hypothetical protein
VQCIDAGGAVVGELRIQDLVLALAGPGIDHPGGRAAAERES